MKLKLNKIFALFSLAITSILLSACHSPGDKIVVETLLDNEAKTWGGDDLPMYPTNEPRVSVLKFTVPPAQKLPKHYHSVINVAYMIKGELTVRDEESNERVVKAGETLVELVGKIHYGENTGKVPAELVVFYVNDETNIPITTKTEAK